MALPPPPPNIHGRYTRLLAMAERGTTHEAAIAETKLASLRSRYDFSVSFAAAATNPEDDLFYNAARIRPQRKASQRLMVFDIKDSAIGNYSKWVLKEGFQIDGVWRGVARGTGTALYVGAKAEDIPHLRHIAEVVTERFKSLWKSFVETTGADSSDEPSFYAGLYDGLMQEPRKAGQAIPRRNGSAKKGRRKARVTSDDTKVRPHAYSIALELGAQIRLNKPLGQITSLLDDLLAPIPDRKEPKNRL